MSPTWRDRLQRAMLARNFNMKELSLASGLGETAVRDALKRRSAPSVATLGPIAKALGMSLDELLEGDATPVLSIPILGAVSAGEGWVSFNDANARALPRLEAKIDGNAVALEVRSDSMAPAYRNGDYIIGSKRAGASADNLIGLDCIILTDKGERYVKYLAGGTARGRFNLRSYNPSHKDVENVKLVWVAPILWVRRSQK
jgi:phage repressor protein C with HTH and peptisase S24 domain